MAKYKLAIIDDRDEWMIGWFLADEQEFGLMLGALDARVLDDGSDSETRAATAAIIAAPADLHPRSLSECEWKWTELNAARKALRIAKEAVRMFKPNKPMPAWAVQARAAGWKAPIGWKP